MGIKFISMCFHYSSDIHTVHKLWVLGYRVDGM